VAQVLSLEEEKQRTKNEETNGGMDGYQKRTRQTTKERKGNEGGTTEWTNRHQKTT
jgi:hypothetical protein